MPRQQESQLVDNLFRDLRFGVRNLRKAPLLVISSVVSLGLGIGGTTVVYSLFQELVLTPPRRGIPMGSSNSRWGPGATFRIRNIWTWSAARRWKEWRATAGAAGESARRRSDHGALIRCLSARTFSTSWVFRWPRDACSPPPKRRPRPRPAVRWISYGCWQTRLGGDPDVVGRVLVINSVPLYGPWCPPRDLRSIFGYGTAPESTCR